MSEIRLKSGHYRTFASRIKFVIERLSNEDEFIEKTGISSDRLKQLLAGEDPSLAELEKINSGYQQILEKWLLTGEGVPLRDSPKELKSLSDYSGICQRFRDERIRHNYTQQEWADIFGRARATIAAIETGRQVFPFDVLRKWHIKFGRSYGFIIDGTEEDVDVSRMIARIEELEQDKEFLKDLLGKHK